MTCPNYWVEWEWVQPGGWRASIRAGELQVRFHRPREAGVVIDLVCGRCGKRTLDRLVANPDFPEAQSIWGGSSELRQRAKVLRDQRTGRWANRSVAPSRCRRSNVTGWDEPLLSGPAIQAGAVRCGGCVASGSPRPS
jgi:hypothetical protein